MTDTITVGPLYKTYGDKYGNNLTLTSFQIPAAPTDIYGRPKVLSQIDYTLDIQANFDRFPTSQYDNAVVLVQSAISYDLRGYGGPVIYAGQCLENPTLSLNQNQINLSSVHFGVIDDNRLNNFCGQTLNITAIGNVFYQTQDSSVALTLNTTITVSAPTNLTFTWTTLPPPPAAFTQGSPSIVSNSAVNITWGASTNATSYEVWRATGTFSNTSTGAWSKITTVNSLSHLDTSVSIGQTYTYYINAVNAYGSEESNFETITTAAPSSFTQLDISAIAGSDNILIQWIASTNADHYEIYRASGYLTSSTSGSWVLQGSTTSALNWTDTAVQLGEVYSYYIKAYNQSLTTDSNVQQIAVNAQPQHML